MVDRDKDFDSKDICHYTSLPTLSQRALGQALCCGALLEFLERSLIFAKEGVR